MLFGMDSTAVSDPRYPLGRFVPSQPGVVAQSLARRQSIQAIAELPGHLSAALGGLTPSQLDTPYRDGGWTLRQLTHHVADSHMNAYTRLRLALTEEWPVIKPYHEALWAELADARILPPEHSLLLLAPLHARWVALLEALDEDQWQRGYVHPESGRTSIGQMTELYSWHGRHHTAHALALRRLKDW
jgi:hypothetical protein